MLSQIVKKALGALLVAESEESADENDWNDWVLLPSELVHPDKRTPKPSAIEVDHGLADGGEGDNMQKEDDIKKPSINSGIETTRKTQVPPPPPTRRSQRKGLVSPTEAHNLELTPAAIEGAATKVAANQPVQEQESSQECTCKPARRIVRGAKPVDVEKKRVVNEKGAGMEQQQLVSEISASCGKKESHPRALSRRPSMVPVPTGEGPLKEIVQQVTVGKPETQRFEAEVRQWEGIWNQLFTVSP